MRSILVHFGVKHLKIFGLMEGRLMNFLAKQTLLA
jgi:hypothetical protein